MRRMQDDYIKTKPIKNNFKDDEQQRVETKQLNTDAVCLVCICCHWFLAFTGVSHLSQCTAVLKFLFARDYFTQLPRFHQYRRRKQTKIEKEEKMRQRCARKEVYWVVVLVPVLFHCYSTSQVMPTLASAVLQPGCAVPVCALNC